MFYRDTYNADYNNINSPIDVIIIVLLTISIQHVSGDNFAHPQEH